MGFDETPDQNFVDLRVPMDQHIAEGDEASVLGDAFRGPRVAFGELAHGFADDLELALHGGLQHDVMLIVVERPSGGELTNPPGRLIDVEAVFERLDR